MNYDDLNQLISEEFVSDEEICDTSLSQHLDQNCLKSTSFNFKKFANENTGRTNQSNQSVNAEKLNPAIGVNVEKLRSKRSPNIKRSNENVNIFQTKIQSSNLKSDSGSPRKSLRFGENKNSVYSDHTELENEINDRVLDMLQKEILEIGGSGVKSNRSDSKQKNDSSKFITIFPSKSCPKVINVTMKEETCRSQRPLNQSELRILSRILNQENMLGRPNESYFNVYYDTESDSNIRYEIRCQKPDVIDSKVRLDSETKNVGLKYNSSLLKAKYEIASGKDKLTRNNYLETRLDGISGSAYNSRDHKRLKCVSESNNDGNKNCLSSTNQEVADNSSLLESAEKCVNLFCDPLKKNNQQCSSQSKCPTCHEECLDYSCLVSHFQKFPSHRTGELSKPSRQLKGKRRKTSTVNELSDKRTKNTGIDDRQQDFRKSNVINEKPKINFSMTAESLSNPATCIEEFLSGFEAKEIAKYAGPIVSKILTSWEYIITRSKQLQSNDEKLLTTIIKELKTIITQIQTISSYVLKPLTIGDEITSNRLTIEKEDIMQHVLGVAPGTYKICEESEWLPGEPKQDDHSLSNSTLSAKSKAVSTAELFQAAVAECLEEDTNFENNVLLDPVTALNCQNFVLLSDKNAPANKIICLNEVPSQQIDPSAMLGTKICSSETNDNSLPTADFSIFNQSSNNVAQVLLTLQENDKNFNAGASKNNDFNSLL